MDTLLSESIYLTPFINAMGDMVRVVTEEGRVLFSNTAFKREMGENPQETCFSAIGMEHRCPNCMAKNVLKSGRVHKQVRKIKNKIYSVTASPLFRSSGEPLAVIEAFRDITYDFELKQELLRSNDKMQKDLEMARSLQSSMVRQDFESIRGVHVSAGFYPCEAIGGDIYDCFESGGKLIFYVSDVAGHGVMPAMLAVFVTRTIRQICDMGELAPDGILSRLQRQFEELNIDESIYITAFIVVMDVASGKFACANAALSVPPLLFDQGKLTEIFIPSRPIGRWFDKPCFTSSTGEIHSGGRILLYTDGIFGADGKDGVMRKISKLFSKAEFNGQSFIQDVRSGLKKGMKDDLTLLVCEKTDNG